jgi:site-specific DNA recombinase
VLARALSGTVFGLDGVRVEVEADIADGLPGFHIVGLGDRALQEARERVKIAINNSGFQFPSRKVTINLAPAQLPKEGSGFDLAMAAAIVNAGEDRGLPGDAAWLGELALDGTLRAIRGTLAIVAHLDRLGVRRFYVPAANVAEARIATAGPVIGVNHFRQLKTHWEEGAPLEEQAAVEPGTLPVATPPVDLAEVFGQPHAKRALEVAAAGAHHLLLVGPPGAGKTLLARALPGILPPLSRGEAVEVTSIASCVGMLPAGAGLLEVAPFRAPHHTISAAALVGGGGAAPRPGEVTRAHLRVTLITGYPGGEPKGGSQVEPNGHRVNGTGGKTSTTRVAIYTRISADKDGCGICEDQRGHRNHRKETPGWHRYVLGRLGVQRQEKACRELAATHGWTVIEPVYEDDDLSAMNGKPRPQYRRLLEDISVGAVQAVCAWAPDRLLRRTTELEEFIDVVSKRGVQVDTVQSSAMLDLRTPTGRALAKTVGAWAQHESELKGERLRAKHLQKAEAGEDGGSGRPYGYESNRQHVRPKEAAHVREAAERVLGGEPLRSVMRDWNKRRIKSATGKEWSVKVLKGMLVSARISGRREYGTDNQGNRLVIGKIVAKKAVWPAIIDVATSDRLRARLTDPARKLGTGVPHKYLLTGGLAVCGIDGGRMMARPKQHWKKGMPSIPSLVCSKTPGHLRIESGPLEELVAEAVQQAVDRGALARALRVCGEDRKAVAELEGVDQKLADLAHDWASDQLTRGEWEAARKTLVARQEGLRRRVEASRRQVGLEGLPDPLRAAWPALPLHRKQAVIRAVVEAVVVGRGIPGLNRFDSRRITLKWKA